MKNKLQVLLISLALVTLLGGCTSTVNVLSPLTENSEITSDKGIVVARVINASGYPLPLNQLRLEPENMNESDTDTVKPELLLAKTPELNGTTVFASSVTPGNYALSYVRAFHTVGNGWYSFFVPAGTDLGTFEVLPGEVTDLGTLVYYTKSQGDKYLKALLRLPGVIDGEVLDKHFEFISYDSARLVTWTDDGKEDERQVEYLSALQNPVQYSESYEAPDGTLYFLAKLGVIMSLAPDGEWQLDAVDTNTELMTISQSKQGDLVTGGAEGRLFFKSAGGDWQDISLNHNEDIVHTNFSDSGEIEAVSQSNTAVLIRRGTPGTEEIDWLELNRYTPANSWTKVSPPYVPSGNSTTPQDRLITSAGLFEIDEKPYIRVNQRRSNLGPVFTAGTTLTFSYNPEDWQMFVEEESTDFDNQFYAGAVKFAYKDPGFWSWSGKRAYYKYSQAEQDWVQIATSVPVCGGEIIESPDAVCESASTRTRTRSFSLVDMPWFTNDREGVVIASFSSTDFWSGQRSSETKILKTIDGGKSWYLSEASLPEEWCSSVVSEITDRLMISCNGFSGDFYESYDMGLSWQQVRFHENF